MVRHAPGGENFIVVGAPLFVDEIGLYDIFRFSKLYHFFGVTLLEVLFEVRLVLEVPGAVGTTVRTDRSHRSANHLIISFFPGGFNLGEGVRGVSYWHLPLRFSESSLNERMVL